MQQSTTGPGPGELGYRTWIAFWGQLILLGLLAVLGAFYASENRASGDYTCGLILSVAAIALAFMRLKSRFDGDAADWASFLLIDDVTNLIAVIVVFTIVGLAGLFIAAGTDHGGLHNGGIALFVTSGLAVFLSLKRFFDNIDRQARD